MPDRDNFEVSLHQYAAEDYKVTHSADEVTPDQQLDFFRRVEELSSPAEFDTDLISVEELREAGCPEDVIFYALSILKSSDHYRIFGHEIYLDTAEDLISPEKTIRVYEGRIIGRTALSFIRETDVAQVELNQQTGQKWPRYEHRLSEVPRFRKSPEQMLIDYIFREERLKAMQAQRAGETLEDLLARTRIVSGNEIFTQERWVRFMKILDVVSLLKELGINDTDELKTD